MLEWLFGFDDPVLESGRIAGTARLALDKGPDPIYSQNVSQSFAWPGWSAGVAGGNNPQIAPSGNPILPQPPASGITQQQLLLVAAAFVVVYLIVKS